MLLENIQLKSTRDGDTLLVRADDTIRDLTGCDLTCKVRLFGIDCPELDQPYGIPARDRLKDMLSDYPFVSLGVRDVDQYGRLVAEIIVDDFVVNTQLLAEGYAVAYRRWLREKRSEYLQAERIARSHKLRFWSQDKIVTPKQWRRDKRRARSLR